MPPAFPCKSVAICLQSRRRLVGVRGRIACFAVTLGALIIFGVTAPTAAVRGGRIAFATNRAQNLLRSAIYSVGVGGTGRRLLALPPRDATELVRSPDGTRILFTRSIDGGQAEALFVARRSGANAVRLSPEGVQWGYVGRSAFSPDGLKVAFSFRGELYVVGVDGSGRQRLTVGDWPTWAPDGRRLAYASNQGISIVGLDGKTRARLGKGFRPVWAPRGERIAYLLGRGGYDIACFVNSDGSRRRCLPGRSALRILWSPDGKRAAFRQVTPSRLVIVGADGRGLHVFKKPRRVIFPGAWSEDGRRIAYVSGLYPNAQIFVRSVLRPGPVRRVTREARTSTFSDVRWRSNQISYIAQRDTNDYEIAVMSSTGQGARILTHNRRDDREPDWSPDGRTIVFSRRQGASANLRLIRADGSRDRPLTNGGKWQDLSPAWSPDGRRIAFVRFTRALYRGTLMVVDRDGTGLRTISDQYALAGGVSWSADGRFLVASVQAKDSQVDLYVFGADGRGWRRLATGLSSPLAPAWSPDGSRILFVAQRRSQPSSGPLDLFTVRPDGTGLSDVIPDVSVNSGGAWASDGRILFVRGNRLPAIFVANSDGSGEVQLTRNYSANVEPSWSG